MKDQVDLAEVARHASGGRRSDQEDVCVAEQGDLSGAQVFNSLPVLNLFDGKPAKNNLEVSLRIYNDLAASKYLKG